MMARKKRGMTLADLIDESVDALTGEKLSLPDEAIFISIDKAGDPVEHRLPYDPATGTYRGRMGGSEVSFRPEDLKLDAPRP